MTPAELRAWRKGLGWTTAEAARQLGTAERRYKYLEQGVTGSGRNPGRPRPEIPQTIVLAVEALTQREKTQRLRRSAAN